MVENNTLFVGLLESTTENINRKEVDKLIGPNLEFHHEPTQGKWGGILVLWRKDALYINVLEAMNQCIFREATFSNNITWNIATIYANKKYHMRRELWNLLNNTTNRSLPLTIGGDFNYILSVNDKKGGKRFTYSQGVKETIEAKVLHWTQVYLV